jgi:hypothetical protein
MKRNMRLQWKLLATQPCGRGLIPVIAPVAIQLQRIPQRKEYSIE